MILYLGDSLTRGTVGYSYVSAMPARDYKNKGVNGDTVNGALRRLMRYRRRPWYARVDTCVLEIGTNDLLQPFLMGRSLVYRTVFGMRAPWKRWAREPEEFERRYRRMVELLLSDGKRVVLVGLTPIQLREYPLEELQQRDGVIGRLARAYGLPFANVLTALERDCPEYRRDYDWGKVGVERVTDIGAMILFPSLKDRFSEKRGLELTVDGVHFNKRAARLVAEEIEKCL